MTLRVPPGASPELTGSGAVSVLHGPALCASCTDGTLQLDIQKAFSEESPGTGPRPTGANAACQTGENRARTYIPSFLN